ncbi:MAG: DNA mismatch repair endonuclease MutL [Candidatus Omnitrophica bacterium]|nr:DNA mismatch repair endonuclease MutL [Candidatus Omnitrophota bacterium]
MGIIKILSEKVANKIAAGEVVERPASIVKELVENSLDAGATSIEIDIRHGGKSLVRVSDNGSGMASDDAELAFERHATSKISSADDLMHVESFGFRGEALPSIAAVSRTCLVTRKKGASTAIEIAIEGGAKTKAKESPASVGTTVEVRDLFFNTPARRKFIKADSTELGHIMDVVSRMALCRRDVRFVLKDGGKTIFDFLAGETLLTRALKVFGEDIKKKDLIEIDEKENGVHLQGLLGKPHVARATRADQIFFINHRWVRSSTISFALQAGFHGLLMHGQYPAAILFLEVDPARVDVNVHPTKQEVRISSEAQIKTFIKESIRARILKEGDLAPELKSSTFSAPSLAKPSFRNEEVKNIYRQSDFPLQKNLAVAEPPARIQRAEETEQWQAPIRVKKLSISKILGQIHHTFIVAETEEGLVIVDQHAAHERVMFEALLKGLKSKKPDRQNLLMEEILEVHPKRRQTLIRALPMLEKIGFEIEEFGEKDFVIRAYPAIFKNESPAAILKCFLEEKEEGHIRSSVEGQAEEVAALIACKRRSVKAYDVMTSHDMRALLESLGECENPFNCPHGRPAFFKQSFSDLERQFKRK